jgi:UDP-2,3-diacylglucosamine pyrophosphatase LpxH
MDATRIIISDLHIGVNDNFDLFKSDTKSKDFERFVDYCRSQTNPIELIINGDFIDFLQLRPWGDYSRTTACAKVQQIAKGSAGIFKKLGELLQDTRHSITILLGNHDVELAYDEVWAGVEAAILTGAPPSGKNRLKFINRRISHNVPVNGVVVHIEHGNEGDPWNAIHYGPLFQDAEERTQTFAYPPGTQFVYNTINQFKEEFKFVDILKPEIPAVPLILLALRPLAAARKIPSAVRNSIDALANGFLTRLRQWISGPQLGPQLAARATTEEEFCGELAQLYGAAAARLSASNKANSADAQDVEVFLRSVGQLPAASQPMMAGVGHSAKMLLLRTALESLERFRQVQQPAQFYQDDHPQNPFCIRAKAQLRGDVRIVVFGHTHEALKTELVNGVYINSGAWANLIGMPTDARDLSAWLETIVDNSFRRTSFPTYVKVEPEGQGVSASLNLWDSTEEKVLWRRTI